MICNKCGQDFSDKNIVEQSELRKIKIKNDYGSKFWGQVISFNLCDECLEGILESFKVKANIKHEYDEYMENIDEFTIERINKNAKKVGLIK